MLSLSLSDNYTRPVQGHQPDWMTSNDTLWEADFSQSAPLSEPRCLHHYTDVSSPLGTSLSIIYCPSFPNCALLNIHPTASMSMVDCDLINRGGKNQLNRLGSVWHIRVSSIKCSERWWPQASQQLLKFPVLKSSAAITCPTVCGNARCALHIKTPT